MQLPIYQVDAFAERLFEGNPAAVVPLQSWLPDAVLQNIAAENNLAETAFFIPAAEGDPAKAGYHIRWFTPVTEVKLCGHATMASAHVLFRHLGQHGDSVAFSSQSGRLAVARRPDGRLELDFPNQAPVPCPAPQIILDAFGFKTAECLANEDFILVLPDQDAVAAARPSMALLAQVELRGIIITAPGKKHDFVSRFFAPRYGIDEDPVTGSAHTQLAPYWGARLGKKELTARQMSRRGGELLCRLAGDRVLIAGRAVDYLVGKIEVPV